MSKIFYLFFFMPVVAFSQKEGDNLIVVTVADTSKLYDRVRQAIVYSYFIIKEDSNRDRLRTYSERIGHTTMFVVAKMIIIGNKVEISGAVGLGSQDFWGDPGWPKSFKRISYYNKGSEEWWRMRSIALKLDGKIESTKR